MGGGPLRSIKVVEMAGLGPCPLAGQLLADLGAEIVVIDRKSGPNLARDVNRRGKRSIAVDLKKPEGTELVSRIVRAADVLIEGFRPGVMERLGLGPDAMLAANTRLVYGRMTGWGQAGPLASTAGHDINYLALTGALHAMGEPGRPPVPPLNLVADYGGGAMFLVAGVLAALIERGVSGQGQVVDAAMVDGVPAMMGLLHSWVAAGGWSLQRGDNLLDGCAPFYRCYETSDGRYVAVGALEPQFFAVLIDLTGLSPEWKTAQMDRAGWPAMTAEFEAVFRTAPRDEWAERFAPTDGCLAPVLDWSEAAHHKHNAARANHLRIGGVTQAAPAPRFSRSVPAVPSPAGRMGADGEGVLARIGYSAAEIEALRRNAVLL